MEPGKDRFYLAISLLAAAFSLIIYYITKAPTTSFWDCGEFIASSYIMGVPHPPGYPVYIIIGRFFTLLPLSSEIAVRVNMISVLGAAAAVFTAYWLIIYVVKAGDSDNASWFSRIGTGIGAFCGAMIMGFSYTFWASAVEAEVYALSMLLMLLISLFSVIWVRNIDKPGNDRYLIIISFLLWLSLGIHMTTFIILIPILGYLAYFDYRKSSFSRWPVWCAMVLFILYAVPVQILVLKIVGVDISNYELESFIVIFAAVLIAVIFKSVQSDIKRSRTAGIWLTALLIMVSAIAGLSAQLYIPVRAAQNPAINENNPSNWTRFKGFLERKQYQRESMVERMFKRRGSWENQLLNHPRFGLMYYFERQYSSPETKVSLIKGDGKEGPGGLDIKLSMLYIIIIGLWGLYETIRRSPPEGVFLLVTILLCTVGLVAYMNFSDGTYNPDIAPIPEVRDRDYFYTPGFMYYGIIMGMGMTFVLRRLGKIADSGHAKAGLCKAAFAISAAGAVALAANTVYANYHHNDRSRNYLPVDYAKNILDSCEENAIIFTNGDNDTFPLWYIQEVENFRTDVRVVNLSLLNAAWYIRQLKDQMNVPITLTDKEIDELRIVRLARYNRILRIQDIMIQHIVSNIQRRDWDIPVYFAITVPDENRMGLDDNLIMEGMAYRIVESKGENRVNTEESWRIFVNPDNFRGIADPTINKDDNDRKLVSNYMVSMFKISSAFAEQGKIDSAIYMAKKAIEIQGKNPMWQSKAYLARIYLKTGDKDKILELAQGEDEGENIILAATQDAIDAEDFDMAIGLLEESLRMFPSSFPSVNNLVVLYRKTGEESKINSVLNKFMEFNRDDKELIKSAEQLIDRLRYVPKKSEGEK
ncbi:MAG: DUF2723 domain-containing protein [Candidatus Zixiibacteriota bacterium]|nr:MAG: DUF2723 domain-containing protein [candidate division Zixibacteria bacterium]